MTLRAPVWFENVCITAGHTLQVLGRSIRWSPRAWRRRGETMRHLWLACYGGMPVTLVAAALTGMIMTQEAGMELARFGQESNIGIIVAASIVREMGPIMTSIVTAGLIGSMMASEIATMKVSDEVDALSVMSIDPHDYLAMPRILALGLAVPAMTIFADAVGILAGGVLGSATLDVDIILYLNNAREWLEIHDLYTGLVKALVFGLTIGSVACSEGLRAEHGAVGVGMATLRTVVGSIVMILVFDFMLNSVYRLIWD